MKRASSAKCALLLLALVLLMSSGPRPASVTAEPGADRGEPGAGASRGQPISNSAAFKNGEILVKFRPNADLPRARADAEKLGLRTVERLDRLSLERMAVANGQEKTVIAKLRANPNVEYAEPNYIRHITVTPNDPSYTLNQPNLPQINAPAAWDLTTGDSSVIIGVVDTGISQSHPDLAAKIAPGGYNFVSGNSNPEDDNGHGSHVSGIAAAATNNGMGIAGVSWGSRVLPVKVLDRYGSGDDATVASGIKWAVDHGAKVINLSLGGPDDSFVLRDAVTYAQANNVLVVAAAGNCAAISNCGGITGPPNPTFYPAAYPGVVAVAAVDGANQYAYFSEFGSFVSVAAPGVNIYSTIPYGISPLGYGMKSGTSMASPHVAGLAALIRSINPNLTAPQTKNIIESTARDLGTTGKDDHYGCGLIDAGAALAAAPAPLSFSRGSIGFVTDPSHSPHQQTLSITNPNGQAVSLSTAPLPTWLTATVPTMVPANSTIDVPVTASTTSLSLGTYSGTIGITGAIGSNSLGTTNIGVTLAYTSQLSLLYAPLGFKN